MAHASHHHEIEKPKKLELPKWIPQAGLGLAVLGAVVFAIALGVNAERAWRGYLIGYWFTLSLALSGPFLVSTQYLTRAGWSVGIRRIPEAFGAFLLPAVALGAIALVGAPKLFGKWIKMEKIVDADTGAILDPIVHAKLGFLNMEGLVITTVVSSLLWAVIYTLLRRNSLAQDVSGDPNLTRKNIFLSAAFIVAFVLGFSFMTWYWIMSLDPHWFSTMYQVYTFAGMFQSGLALTAMILIALHSRGYFGGVVGVNQIHDIGKFVFAFTVFYAYIGFSQYLLIWYANIPEEAVFYLQRLDHGWAPFTLALPFLKFVIPFLILLPQDHKKNKNGILFYVSGLLVFMQLYEVWYLVMPYPGIGGDYSPKALFEIPVALGFVGLFTFVVSRALAANNLVPMKDPFLHESIPHAHHHGSSEADSDSADAATAH